MDIVEKYDRAAKAWDQRIARAGYKNAYEGFLGAHINHAGPTLDAGTGTGAFAHAWIGAGGSHDLTLLDPAEKMLSIAKSKLSKADFTPKTIQCRIDDYQPSQKFSTILAAHVVEQCQKPKTAFENLASWLDEDGKLILVISKPHWCNWIIWLRFRHKWFNPAQVKDLVKNADLTHIHTHKFLAGPPSRTSFGYVFIKK